MKVKNLFLSLLISLSGLPALALMDCHNGDAETLSMAEGLHQSIEDAYRRGLIKRSEYSRDELFLYEAKHCSGALTKLQFCQRALPILRELTSNENRHLGTDSPAERREQIQLFAEAKKYCNK